MSGWVLDPRVSGWPLMSSPLPTVALTLLYLAFVALGPAIARALPPLSLRPLLVAYNAAVASLSAYIFYELVTATLGAGYNYTCQDVNASGHPELELRIAAALWWFYISKLAEFLDTVFFVVRGKLGQVSFLHVYHHSTMFCLWWVGARFVPGGSTVVGPLLNCLVHVVMYGYYGLSAAFPNANFWWKKYITVLQLAQFWTVMTLTTMGLWKEDCKFPTWMAKSLILYMASFVALFTHFYSKAYSPKAKAVKRN